MKKVILFFTVVTCFALALPMSTLAADKTLAKKLSGRILLQTESYGRAWYVNPADGTRYYLKDGNEAYKIMQTMGLGITNTDLAKIPMAQNQPKDKRLVSRLSGRILLQVDERGQAWYINPVNGLRYYLKDGEAAYALMKTFALGIRNTALRSIPINSKQLVHDTTFDDVAYVLLRQGNIVASKNENQILPLASMSKLMTALVLLDQPGLNWNKVLTITQKDIDYPVELVGSDATSEVELQTGDMVSVYDLWVAMLVASSNQAAITLVDSSGLSRSDFVAAMNRQAVALGLTHTFFYEPTGLDAHNVTTPREMALLAKISFDKTEITEATKQNGYVIMTKQTPSRSVEVIDRNFSLQKYGANAAKTGFLVEAQRCVSLKRGDDIIVIMHARSMKERNQILDKLTNYL